MKENSLLSDQAWRLALIERTIEEASLMIETRCAVQAGQFSSVAATPEFLVADGLPTLFEAQAALYFALKMLNARAMFLKGTQGPGEQTRAAEIEAWTVEQAKTLRDQAEHVKGLYLELLKEFLEKNRLASGRVVQ
jgi:hypothetical protein